MINIKKEDLIFTLKNIINALEDTNKVDIYKFYIENETQDVGMEDQTATRFTGWMKIDFSFRFLKIR